MSFLEDRAGAEQVEDALVKAAEGQHTLLMSVVNWGEVYYSIWRLRGEEVARESLRQIGQLAGTGSF